MMLWAALWLFIFDMMSEGVSIPAWVYIIFCTMGIVRLIILACTPSQHHTPGLF